MVNQHSKSFIKRVLEHDALRIIGFIADMLAIGAALLAINFPNPGAILSKFLSPAFLFLIWCLAFYTYICILHDQWIKHKSAMKWSNSFYGFLSLNLVIEATKPWLLYQFVLLIISLYVIVYIAFKAYFSLFLLTIALTFAGGLLYTFFIDTILRARYEKSQLILESNKEMIDKKWKSFETIITKLLPSYTWMSAGDIKSLMKSKGLTESDIEYVFAKYAAKFPEKVIYGDIYKRVNEDTGELYCENVLVNIEKLDRNVYVCG